MKAYSIFGKNIAIKTKGCRHNDETALPIPPSVNLFVKITNTCNARCLFCSNAGYYDSEGFDIDKLFDCIDEIRQQGIIINRLNITGGEPAVVGKRVNTLLNKLEKELYEDIHVHLNTNGLLVDSKELMRHGRWDSISVSLHHYNITRLSELYGVKINKSAMHFDGIDMMKVNASCNLIKGYIDSTDEANKMMDYCLELGFTRLGFVGLMSVNDYCKKNLVSLDTLKLDKIQHCYFTERKNRGTDCCCSNYLYNKNCKVLDIYMRHYMNPQYCESSLLFDGHFLRQGFLDNNIIY